VIEINGVANYYGKLQVEECQGKFYMRMGCVMGGSDWSEISSTLYQELVALNDVKYKFDDEVDRLVIDKAPEGAKE
tara:strand:- start:227 stop:454 length:228 start_codon:yes stop_codon:yes gene_type:complete